LFWSLTKTLVSLIFMIHSRLERP